MENEVNYVIDKSNIAHVTLNRPHLHNAMDERMIQKLIHAFEDLHKNPSVRALILRGNGGSFCSGADLESMKKTFKYDEAKNYEDASKLSYMLHLLDTIKVPTVASVHGVVMGGGLGLIACCDIVLGAFNTMFSFPEVKLGIVPAVISPYVIRAIGARQASRYFLTGEKFDASIAQQIGLIHQVIELDQGQSEVDRIINNILSGGPHAVQRAKELIREISGNVPEEVRRMTAKLIADMRVLDEGQEGLGAYLNKTLPNWVPK